MTIIVYRDGVMAADGRVTSKAHIFEDDNKKIERLKDGSLIGTSGNVSDGLRLLDKMKELVKAGDRTLPDVAFKGVGAIFVTASGKYAYQYEDCTWDATKRPYYYIGSGSYAAHIALEMGATAVEAVRMACSKNVYCGGRIRVLKLKRE